MECDILTEDGLNRTRTMAPLILPHELFGALHSQSAESWRTHVVNPDVCTKFWQEISTAPYMANHPVATNPSLWSTTVPLGFHGGCCIYKAGQTHGIQLESNPFAR